MWPDWPRAGMQFEERGPHRFRELGARAPGLVYPILNIEVLFASFRQSIFPPGLAAPGITAMPSKEGSGSCHSVILLPRHHSPDDARHLVGERDGRDHSRLSAQNASQPVVG